MVQKSLERNGKSDSCNFIQGVKKKGIKVLYIEDTTLAVKKLRAPFIKVEDHSRQFKPLVVEMNEWPNLDEMFNDNNDTKNVKPKFERRDESNRYCGLCEQYYVNINSHVKSSMHRRNARDESKWRTVDNLIRRQPTPAEFVESMIKISKDNKH